MAIGDTYNKKAPPGVKEIEGIDPLAYGQIDGPVMIPRGLPPLPGNGRKPGK